MLLLRSLAFNILFYANLIGWLLFGALPALLLPWGAMWKVARGWARSALWLQRAMGVLFIALGVRLAVQKA